MKIDSKRCPQNHACPAVKVCPTDAIGQKAHSLPVIDESRCIKCGACISCCPMRAISE